jgi:hypothetical protein
MRVGPARDAPNFLKVPYITLSFSPVRCMPYRNSEAKRAANRRHYEKNKDHYRTSAREARKRYKAKAYAFVNEIKSTTPCTDCGKTFDPICMDFDHCQGGKLDNISRMVNLGRPMKIIEDEIAKCELVCACCHRIRTRDRG